MNLGLLTVDELILHEVPVPPIGGGGGGPTLSDAASPLDSDLRNFFQTKIRSSLMNEGLAVEKDPAVMSPVPDTLRDLIKGDDLVKRSQEIAQHLYSVQTRQNSGGLLVVSRAHVGQTSTMAILKLERKKVPASRTGE